MKMPEVVLGLALVVFAVPAYGHPGFTNDDGCHTEDDGTNYHCHSDEEIEEFEVEHGQEREEPADRPSPVERRASAEAQLFEELEETRTELMDLRQEVRDLRQRPTDTGSLDDDSAITVFGISMATIGSSALLGATIASTAPETNFSDVVFPFVLSSLSAGLVSSSIFSLQVGLESGTYWAGGGLVGLNALGPVVAGLAMRIALGNVEN